MTGKSQPKKKIALCLHKEADKKIFGNKWIVGREILDFGQKNAQKIGQKISCFQIFTPL